MGSAVGELFVQSQSDSLLGEWPLYEAGNAKGRAPTAAAQRVLGAGAGQGRS
jgi:hypothetical protein